MSESIERIVDLDQFDVSNLFFERAKKSEVSNMTFFRIPIKYRFSGKETDKLKIRLPKCRTNGVSASPMNPDSYSMSLSLTRPNDLTVTPSDTLFTVFDQILDKVKKHIVSVRSELLPNYKKYEINDCKSMKILYIPEDNNGNFDPTRSVRIYPRVVDIPKNKSEDEVSEESKKESSKDSKSTKPSKFNGKFKTDETIFHVVDPSDPCNLTRVTKEEMLDRSGEVDALIVIDNIFCGSRGPSVQVKLDECILYPQNGSERGALRRTYMNNFSGSIQSSSSYSHQYADGSKAAGAVVASESMTDNESFDFGNGAQTASNDGDFM